jgi:hypothetical protein
MACSCSENACRNSVRFFGWVIAAALGVVVIASLPELKRYIKISTM